MLSGVAVGRACARIVVAQRLRVALGRESGQAISIGGSRFWTASSPAKHVAHRWGRPAHPVSRWRAAIPRVAACRTRAGAGGEHGTVAVRRGGQWSPEGGIPAAGRDPSKSAPQKSRAGAKCQSVTSLAAPVPRNDNLSDLRSTVDIMKKQLCLQYKYTALS